MKRTLALTLLATVLALVLSLSVGAKSLTMWDCETTEHSWSDGDLFITDGKTGKAVGREIDAFSMAANIICHEWLESPIDISEYYNNDDGALHVWVYISDAEEIEVGQGLGVFEIYSNAEADGTLNYFSWQVSDILSTGWNELTLKFKDGVNSNNFNPAAVNQMRLFQYGYSFAMYIDEMEVVIPESGNNQQEENQGNENQGNENQGGGDTSPATADALSVVLACAAVAGLGILVARKKAR